MFDIMGYFNSSLFVLILWRIIRIRHRNDHFLFSLLFLLMRLNFLYSELLFFSFDRV